ncbi:MAG: alanine racemase [Christensenellales bacterium]|jgi:D-serine deaminase-like pyridoxal phosphate-dependent protein
MNNSFDTPVAIVDADKVKRNISKMIEKLAAYGISHRPHMKSHKTTYFAKLQLEMGASGITCAKISEAEVMVDSGINDILIANEIIGFQKCERLMKLAKRAHIITLVDSWEGALGLEVAAAKSDQLLEVYIEVNTGADRCGVKPEQVNEIAKKVINCEHLNLTGLMGYGGNVYGKAPGDEMIRESGKECEVLLWAKESIKSRLKYDINILSAGSSYSSRYPQTLNGLTESRAGNYLFNDKSTLSGGFCTLDECALYVVATIISTPEPGRAIIDAGTKTLSSDKCHYSDGYGYIVEYPEMKIYALDEEHGYISYDAMSTPKIKIGEQIKIIPNHACVIPNLVGELILQQKNGKSQIIEVDACRKLQ